MGHLVETCLTHMTDMTSLTCMTDMTSLTCMTYVTSMTLPTPEQVLVKKEVVFQQPLLSNKKNYYRGFCTTIPLELLISSWGIRNSHILSPAGTVKITATAAL